MSSISSISSGSGLSQILQKISQGGSSASSGSSLLAPAHKHKKSGGLGGFDKLAAAVTNALQSATTTGSGSTPADANQTITQALTKIFKNGSVDSDGTPDTDSDDANSPSGVPASFAATLQSFGVTPQQFQSDLSAALTSAQQSGTADTSAAFKSFPTGSIVDMVG